MKTHPIALLALSCALCQCTQENPVGVKIHRLQTAAAPAAPQSHRQTYRHNPAKRSHFNIYTNETLLKCPGEKHLAINLATQRGTFYVNGLPAMDFPVCTGKKGFETPTGIFSIKEKRRHHRSNIYHVSMPCFMRLTYDGIGLHVGEIYANPASHGCIRLPKEACLPIFHAISPGTKVVIF